MKWYCGVHGCRYIYHNNYSDSEIIYKNKIFFAEWVEEGLADVYEEEHPEDKEYKNFHQWIGENPELLYEELENMILSNSYTTKSPELSEAMDDEEFLEWQTNELPELVAKNNELFNELMLEAIDTLEF